MARPKPDSEPDPSQPEPPESPGEGITEGHEKALPKALATCHGTTFYDQHALDGHYNSKAHKAPAPTHAKGEDDDGDGKDDRNYRRHRIRELKDEIEERRLEADLNKVDSPQRDNGDSRLDRLEKLIEKLADRLERPAHPTADPAAIATSITSAFTEGLKAAQASAPQGPRASSMWEPSLVAEVRELRERVNSKAVDDAAQRAVGPVFQEVLELKKQLASRPPAHDELDFKRDSELIRGGLDLLNEEVRSFHNKVDTLLTYSRPIFEKVAGVGAGAPERLPEVASEEDLRAGELAALEPGAPPLPENDLPKRVREL